ncbi:unnamed protein product [Rotaria sordida]|uniref:Uncharacterized protein n=1 Tax=Rotaria sordida TaxID=392033 RepID=A0A813XDF0_9BILA|nr:unnamed protein product [Rotaria sordida]CAF3513222.1 unnamed protein product [Rotaria sordida]
MRQIYTSPTLAPHQPTVLTNLLNSSITSSKNSIIPPRLSFHPDSFRHYISQQIILKPIRGRELFIRSIRRIIEQIRDKNQRTKNDQQLFSTYEEAINIFNDLTFMKCILFKKKLLDSNNRAWTIEFARQGGLHTLLAYLEQIIHKGLSLVDAILVNETLQCLRAMMNINELFEHIASNPQYIDSIAKILSVPSAEIRMRVFELLTALCVYSQDGYELVLNALQDFQTNNKLSNVFAVILEQLKFAVMAKHKWSAIALLNSILSSTEEIEKRLSYRNILYSNGIISILEQAQNDNNIDLNFQIDIFFEDQKHDEEEFLGNFDSNDSQAVYQAIQLQLAPNSNESALFLTTMQLLYSTLASSNSNERQKILQHLLQSLSQPIEKKMIIEQASQTDVISEFDIKSSSTYQQVPTITPVITNEKSLQKPYDTSILINTEKSIDNKSPSNELSVRPPLPANIQIDSSPIPISRNGTKIPPPPPFPGGLLPPPPPPLPGFSGGPSPPLPPSFPGGLPPPPPPPLPDFSGRPPPPPPPPPGFLGRPPPLGQFSGKAPVAGLSVLVDSIPKPKGKVRRLQWKKLPQTILATSQFWMDVNKKVDTQINFSQLENCFKVNNENSNILLQTKNKATNILPHNRSIAINVFLKKFNFTELQSLVQSLQDSKSNLNNECLRMLLKVLPNEDEINLIHDHPRENWTLPEEFIHEISSISYYAFRVQTRILITEFDETFDDFKRKYESIIRVINFLQHNSSIKQLARSLLSIGDFLNYDSYAGNAVGFRLDILKQLHDIRTSENKNLLGVLLESSPENFKFIDNLKPLIADDIQLKLVKSEYMDWKNKIDNGLKQINSIADKQIIEQYKPFYEQSNIKVNHILEPLVNQCEKQELELMKEFGETDLSEFNYDICCMIFRQLIEKVEKEIKEQEKRLTSNKILLNSTKLEPQKLILTNDNMNKLTDNHFMDSIMIELKQKKFSTVPARRRRLRPDLTDLNDREYK